MVLETDNVIGRGGSNRPARAERGRDNVGCGGSNRLPSLGKEG